MNSILIPLITLCLGLLPTHAGDIHIRGRLSEESKGEMKGGMMSMDAPVKSAEDRNVAFEKYCNGLSSKEDF